LEISGENSKLNKSNKITSSEKELSNDKIFGKNKRKKYNKIRNDDL